MERKLIIGLIALLITVSCGNIHAAQRKQTLHDYRTTINSVEILQMQDYHLQQAKQKIIHNQPAYAWGDLAYLLCYIPNHHVALQQMLEIALVINKQGEMIKFFDKAIKIYPQDEIVYALYSSFLYKIGDVNNAAKYLELAQEINPNLSSEYQSTLHSSQNVLN